MGYQVLARKWRPRTFAEMVGQEHVLRALINALDNQRLHHAYLYTGTRGVGKTTVARIFAKSLNCEQGVSATPCGQCSACREIDEGRFVDLIEVDAASRTKVEDTRELLDNVQYAPTQGRYKVYLIDEVHMLSGHSFNALLKTLEEPPPHVKFLLATTDPQKLPITILSRCLQFNLKRLSPELIRGHLAYILEQEGLGFEAEALVHLARAADGSMRDALSLLDQAIAFGGGGLKTEDVTTMLGTIERGHVYALLETLAVQDGAGLMAQIEQMAQQSPDFSNVLAELLTTLHWVALAQSVPAALGEEVPERERILTLAENMAAEDVQLFYQIGLIGRRDLPLSPEPRAGFEMVMLRMLAFRPADAGQGGGGSRLAASTKAPAANAPVASASITSASVTSATATAAPDPIPSAAPTHGDASPAAEARAALEAFRGGEVSKRPSHAESRHGEPDAAMPESVVATEVAASPPEASVTESVSVVTPSPIAPQTAPETVAQAVPPVEKLEAEIDPARWTDIIAALNLGGMAQQFARNCAYEGREGDTILLSLHRSQAPLLNAKHEARLQEGLQRQFGAELQVQVTLVDEVAKETPSQVEGERQALRQQAAEEAIMQDPNVQSMIEHFGAQVDRQAIRPK